MSATSASCTHCGAALWTDARFCAVCGRPVGRNPPAGELSAAPYLLRLAAWLVDAVVVCGLLVLLVLVAGVALVSASTDGSGGHGESGVGLAIVLVAVPAAPLYSALLHTYWSGRTLGKLAAGIAVLQRDGSRIGLGQSLGRSYLRFALLAIFPAWVVDSLWPLWQRQQRSLHDLAADTIVVRSRG